jgi:glucosamine-6-phosphate deaminase
MGIGTILAAKACLVLGTGEGKSDAIAAMIEGPLSARCPASALQMHPAVTVIVDRAAAAGLKLGDDYQRVHPNGA